MTFNASRALKVLITHDEPLLAAGLAATLSQFADIQVVVAEPSDKPDTALYVDVVVADYDRALSVRRRMETTDALQVSKRGRVLLVAANDREHEVRCAMECGVHGYLVRDCSTDELLTAVRTLGNGARYVSLGVAQRMAESLTRDSLTSRESQVLRLLASGSCNKTIARELDISLGTVKTHLQSVLCKLDASSRTHAVTIATSRGLIEHDAATAMPDRSMRASARLQLS